MSTTFSVIVPIYKVEKYLNKCIDSILKQTFQDFELILVDDGSPDKCPKICDEYAKKDKRVRVIHKENAGLVAARNTGIKEAKGDYICYVDGDDWISENLLQTVWSKAVSKYDVEMVVYSAVRQFTDTQEQIPKSVPEGLYNKDKLRSDVYPYMMYDSRKPFCTGLIFPVAWNKIFKRDFLLKHYCQEERIRMGEDNAFVFECLYAAENVFFCDDILYIYNQLNVESMVHSYDPNRFDNNKLLTDYIERRIGKRDPIIDEQINAFKAYWLIMAVVHEIKSKRKITVASKHIRLKIKETEVLKGIKCDGLPKSAKMYLILLNMHLYIPALLAAKLITVIRGKAFSDNVGYVYQGSRWNMYAHSMYYELLGETGIVGIVLFGFFMLYSLVYSLRLFKNSCLSNVWKGLLWFSISLQILFIVYGYSGNVLYDKAQLFTYLSSISMLIAVSYHAFNETEILI